MTMHVEGAQDQNGCLTEEQAKLRLPPGSRPPDLLEAEEKLKAERVQERLRQEAPSWRLINHGTGINRARALPDARAAMAYVSYVSVMAACLRLPVVVQLTGTRAVLSLQGRRKGKDRGVTDAMVDFAAAIG